MQLTIFDILEPEKSLNNEITKIIRSVNPEQYDQWLQIQKRQAVALEKIAELLEQSLPRPAPNYKAILENFHDFDWSEIGAEVELADSYGVASVIWKGDRYKRRSPNNSYGAVIFFSRYVGKDDHGNNQYEKLITFEPLKKLEVEPISQKAMDGMTNTVKLLEIETE